MANLYREKIQVFTHKSQLDDLVAHEPEIEYFAHSLDDMIE
ncbi:MAG: hypothetical protein Q9M11_01810 [Mariprofundaceae bacterium]|nr:hypothetical protein [Mariprofundaceae bacterium]